MNALDHMTAGLVAAYPDVAVMRFDDYYDADAGVHPSISDNPFMVLQADNSNKLRTLRQALIDAGMPRADFTRRVPTLSSMSAQRRRRRLNWNTGASRHLARWERSAI